MVLLHKHPHWCSRMDTDVPHLEPTEGEGRDHFHWSTYQTPRSCRHVFPRTSYNIFTAGSPVGWFDVFLEQWPHHCPLRCLWRLDPSLRYRPDQDA